MGAENLSRFTVVPNSPRLCPISLSPNHNTAKRRSGCIECSEQGPVTPFRQYAVERDGRSHACRSAKSAATTFCSLSPASGWIDRELVTAGERVG